MTPNDGTYAPGAVMADAADKTNERKGMLTRKYARKTDPEIEGQKQALLDSK